jgi:hypothetical protein
MLIIGLDYHPSVQQIAFVDLETGETGERQLNHNEGEVEEFYRELKQHGISVRVGMEACSLLDRQTGGVQARCRAGESSLTCGTCEPGPQAEAV